MLRVFVAKKGRGHVAMLSIPVAVDGAALYAALGGRLGMKTNIKHVDLAAVAAAGFIFVKSKMGIGSSSRTAGWRCAANGGCLNISFSSGSLGGAVSDLRSLLSKLHFIRSFSAYRVICNMLDVKADRDSFVAHALTLDRAVAKATAAIVTKSGPGSKKGAESAFDKKCKEFSDKLEKTQKKRDVAERNHDDARKSSEIIIAGPSIEGFEQHKLEGLADVAVALYATAAAGLNPMFCGGACVLPKFEARRAAKAVSDHSALKKRAERKYKDHLGGVVAYFAVEQCAVSVKALNPKSLTAAQIGAAAQKW